MEPTEPTDPDPTAIDREFRRPRWLTDRTAAGFAIYELEPGLLTGRQPLTALDVQRLADLGVTHLLDLRQEREWKGPGRHGSEAVEAMPAHGIERHALPIPDGEAPDPATLDLATDLIDQVLRDGSDPAASGGAPGGVLFVHCRAGIERTGTIVLAHRCRRDALPVGRALESITSDESPYAPLPWQVTAVRRWLSARGRDDPASEA